MERFDAMHKVYKKGLISKEYWDTYCAYCLDKLIQANKDVLLYLKKKQCEHMFAPTGCFVKYLTSDPGREETRGSVDKNFL